MLLYYFRKQELTPFMLPKIISKLWVIENKGREESRLKH